MLHNRSFVDPENKPTAPTQSPDVYWKFTRRGNREQNESPWEGNNSTSGHLSGGLLEVAVEGKSVSKSLGIVNAVGQGN
jgi:hypothetical protein